MKKYNRKSIIRFSYLILVFVSLFSLLSVQLYSQTSCYHVDINGTSDDEDGLSWADAYKKLDSALVLAQAGDTIKVASGIYKPSSTGGCSDCPVSDRYNYFLIDTSIVMLGSFNPLVDTQNYSQPSVLSGDIGVQGDTTDNILQVLIILQAGHVTIDGFIIENGNATPNASTSTMIDGLLVQRERGGGAYISAATTSTQFYQCAFRDNYAGSGGAIFAFSPIHITNSTFRSNRAALFGGAVVLRTSPNRFNNVSFEENMTLASNSEGGAVNIHIDATATFSRCQWINNIAAFKGGAIFSRGPSHYAGCVWENNRSVFGGAIYAYNDTLSVANSVMVNNSASTSGGTMYMQTNTASFINVTAVVNQSKAFHTTVASGMDVWNSILTGNDTLFIDTSGITASYSLLSQSPGTGSQNMVGVDPQFHSPTTPAGNDDIWYTADDGYRLFPCSPAINSALDSIAADSSDIIGTDRIQAGQVDIGAYESPFDSSIYTITRLHVDSSNISGVEDGLSWATAFTKLQDAFNTCLPTSIVEVWVAKGTYYPDEGAGLINNDHNAAFIIPNGVTIYGGFLGIEDSLHQRNWNSNITLLSGEIQQDMVFTNNSRGVVKLINNVDTTSIDGIHIKHGRYIGSNEGAGGITIQNCIAQISNCSISNNSANVYGVNAAFSAGGVFIGSSAVIRNCNISNNSGSAYDADKTYSGGGVFIGSSTKISNCTISNNSATSSAISTYQFSDTYSGGGVFIGADANIYNSVISQNYAEAYASNSFGSASSAGGVFIGWSADINNCTLTRNYGTADAFDSYAVGGILTSASSDIFNNIIWNNDRYGNDMQAFDLLSIGSDIKNIQYNLLRFYPGDSTNIIGVDPNFLVPDGSGNYRLSDTSIAIHAGNNDFLPLDIHDADMDGNSTEYIPIDLDGNPRIQGWTVDMGAYEYDSKDTLFVDHTADGDSTGRSWTNAAVGDFDVLDFTFERGIEVVHIAEGNYSLDNSSVINSGLVLRGGFPNGGGVPTAGLHLTQLNYNFSSPFFLIDANGKDVFIRGLHLLDPSANVLDFELISGELEMEEVEVN